MKRDDRIPVVFAVGFCYNEPSWEEAGEKALNRIRRWTALAAAALMLAAPTALSRAEVMAEKTEMRGKVTQITWKDENGSVTAGPEGYAEIRYAYDKSDTTEKYYDAEGAPYQTAGGYYGRIMTRDGRGNISSVTYLDENGKMAVNSLGYARVMYKYFSSREEREVIYCGADGKTPVIVPSLGYAQMETKHSGNTLIGRVYKDPKGNPIDTPAGYATLKIQLSKKNAAPIKIEYLHADDSRATGPDGWSYCMMERDARGKLMKTEYFDVQGYLTRAGGCAREEYTYGKDNLVTVSRFDAEGNRIPYDGAAVSVCRRMKGEKVLEETFLNEAGEPVALSAGYTSVSYTYNANGDLEMTQYRDAAGNKATCKQGYSAIRETRNAEGQLISRQYLDISEQPVNNNVSGVSEERYEYDEDGRLTGVQKYDSQGNLVVSD